MTFMKAFFLLLVIIAVVVESTFPQEDRNYWNSIGQKNLKKQLNRFKHQAAAEKKPKNIILFIGDGMGLTAIAAARMLYAEQQGKIGQYSDYPFFFESFPVSGIQKTASLSHHVTDSAAGAVALLTGRKVEQDTINLRPGKPRDCSEWETSGMVNETITSMFLNKGGNVGVVTTTHVTDGTPAPAYAQGVTRFYDSDIRTREWTSGCDGKDIALQLLNSPADKFKVIMGGGAKHLKESREDGRDVFEEWSNLPGKRRTLTTKEDLEGYSADDEEQVLGIFAPDDIDFREELIKTGAHPHLRNMTEKAIEIVQKKNEKGYFLLIEGIFAPDDIDFREELIKTGAHPHLRNMTEKAIEIVQKKNEKGYFLLIEGARVDQAEHYNQMRRASEELFEFDEAIKAAREMTNPEETLIIVTADHSHSVALPGYRLKNDSLYGGVDLSVIPEFEKAPGVIFVAGFNQTINYTDADGASTDFRSPSMIYFSWGSVHGGEDVPIYADGPYSWLFSGSMENTEVAYMMKFLLCLQEEQECEEKEEEGEYWLKRLDSAWKKFTIGLSAKFKW